MNEQVCRFSCVSVYKMLELKIFYKKECCKTEYQPWNLIVRARLQVISCTNYSMVAGMILLLYNSYINNNTKYQVTDVLETISCQKKKP